MDPNGLRFWLLADRKDWVPDENVVYDDVTRRLRLASELADLPTPPENADDAVARLALPPAAFDGYGAAAFLDGDRLRVRSQLPTVLDLAQLPPAAALTDLAMGYDGVLYAAVDDGVLLIDKRERWQPGRVPMDGFAAWRLAPDPGGGAWALDRVNRQIGRVLGLPLANRVYHEYSPEVARPVEDDLDPPRLLRMVRAELPADEAPVALATGPQGIPALLSWPDAAGTDARLRLVHPQTGSLSRPIGLRGARYPYSLAWLSATQVAMMQVNTPGEAFIYDVGPMVAALARDAAWPVAELSPLGDYYPLRDHGGGPFLKGVTLPPHYPTAVDGVAGQAPLHPLSYPNFAEQGASTNRIVLDSGDTQTVWHRLYLEAVIPQYTGVRVWLAASLTPDEAVPDDEWFEHRFGEVYAPSHGRGPGDGAVPVGAWSPAPSEAPGHPGLLDCPTERDRAGLFTVLIQRSGRRVRSLRGRHLRVRLELAGDRRATPEIAGLRAYASRFSYVERYLPELYHEHVYAPDADVPAPSTEADFLERFVHLFEGLLTPMEDRVANAHIVMDARTAPETALEWLAGWIGLSFDPAYPTDRRRDLLAVAPRLFRVRGTLLGLKLALDVATGGGVRGGEIVVLEDYRLRRTFTTILGADLADEDDPLTQGLAISGNSYVGDTLFLGDEAAERRKEFLALFRDDLPKTAAERGAVAAFLDRLTHRATILVHREVEPQDFKLIRRVVEMECPAHVEVRVFPASYSFLVGMAALVGVDTYLGPEPPARPVTLNKSRLGERDFLVRPASLDPRLSGSVPETLVISA